MGICKSTNNKNKHLLKNSETLKKLGTLKRGETIFGRRGDQTDRIMGPESVEGGSMMAEAFVSLTKLLNNSSTFKIKMFILNGKPSISNKYTQIGETESNFGEEHIIFNISFIFEYFFEKEQLLKFEVYQDENMKAAEVLSTVGKIMGSRGSSITLPVMSLTSLNKQLGELTIDCKNAKKSMIELKLDVSCRLTSLGVEDEYLELFYLLNNFNDGKNWRHVYKSNEQSGEKISQINFTSSRLMSDEVCNTDYNQLIKFEFFDVSIGLLGMTKVSINQLKSKPNWPIYQIVSNEQEFANTKVVGECIINFSEQKVFKFLDYLKMGMQMNLIVGVDFTCSNGNPDQIDSLHYFKGTKPNLYERAIKSCGSIVAYYDYDQRFPVFGFGGRVPGETKVNHCFNLNLDSDPNVKSVESIIETYKTALYKIRLDGPTYFAPLILTTLNNIKVEMNNSYNQGQSVQIYYVLMILTDGNINDMDATCDVLVECDIYPLSVIIIGIGKADFSNMNILDGDEVPLTNSRGVKTRRDLVQFVEFNKFQDEGDATKLAEEVLKEVPRQVEEYYKLTNSFTQVEVPLPLASATSEFN